jgi:surface antigen
MKSTIGHRTHVTIRWGALLIALTVTIASLLQAATIKPALATDSDGYPWPLAPCADSGTVLGQTTGSGYWCSGYNWGESPCPTNDGYCTSGNLMNGYYLYDQWGEGFRNCVSYTAWKLSTEFGINPSSWGNGKDWNNSALAAHYTDDTSPQIGDIAQWDASQNNSFGHVAYVYNVVNGVASYDEYNYAMDGTFDSTKTSTSQGAPNHWIHFGTPPPTNPLRIGEITTGGVGPLSWRGESVR